MYRDEEIKTSFKYLKEVIGHLDEPIYLLGGWAVYFSVNERFQKEKGYPYLGSRDIDLGFDDAATANKVIDKLKAMGFKRLSFRFFKEVHSETMKELSEDEAKRTPLHYIFPMYVDLIVSKTDQSMKAKLGFMPIDEPLLKHAFENRKNQKKSVIAGKSVILPSASLLLAMKICSIASRDKEDKMVKDVCDILALCLYSGKELDKLKEAVISFVGEAKLRKNLGVVGNKEIQRVSQLLAIDSSVISGAIERLRI